MRDLPYELDLFSPRIIARSREIGAIVDGVEGMALQDHTTSAFYWREPDPDLTAEEVASMAADGFDVPD